MVTRIDETLIMKLRKIQKVLANQTFPVTNLLLKMTLQLLNKTQLAIKILIRNKNMSMH